MFSSVTKWLGVIDNRENEETLAVDEKGEETKVEQEVTDQKQSESDDKKGEQEDNDDLISPETKKTLEEASAKAINTAKEWGNYLYAFGKQASEKVAETAKDITKSVEEKTFLGEFSKEQDKFVTEQKEKEKRSEAAVPPWVGYNEEEEMKSQILALSQDRRNFLRNPPTGIQFQFDFDTVFPVAMATLQEDPNLQKMRFELVPKQVKESNFWRNYFYRVSLIKQSTQLTSLAQQTGSPSGRSSDRSRDSSASSSNRERSSPVIVNKQTEDEDIGPGSPPADNEFVSDAFQEEQISDEDFKKEMQLLGVEDDAEKVEGSSDEIPEWEQELQKELQEYEVVNEGGDIDDLEIENEILKQIEQDADQS